jgi:hypothetical protein
VNVRRSAAFSYVILTGAVVIFQLSLAAGAPWGEFAMGGAYPGQLPPSVRIAAVVQALLLSLMAGVVLSRAGVALSSWSRHARWLIWVVVGIAALASVLNIITPSGGERAIWAPVAVLLFVTSLVVALTPAPPVFAGATTRQAPINGRGRGFPDLISLL